MQNGYLACSTNSLVVGVVFVISALGLNTGHAVDNPKMIKLNPLSSYSSMSSVVSVPTLSSSIYLGTIAITSSAYSIGVRFSQV